MIVVVVVIMDKIMLMIALFLLLDNNNDKLMMIIRIMKLINNDIYDYNCKKLVHNCQLIVGVVFDENWLKYCIGQ